MKNVRCVRGQLCCIIGPCERKIEIGDNEYGEIWREWCWFKEKINSIKKSQEVKERNIYRIQMV